MVELPPVATVLQIFVIDLLLSGDNAVVVALRAEACRFPKGAPR